MNLLPEDIEGKAEVWRLVSKFKHKINIGSRRALILFFLFLMNLMLVLNINKGSIGVPVGKDEVSESIAVPDSLSLESDVALNSSLSELMIL